MAKNGKLPAELAEAFEADVGYGFEEVKNEVVSFMVMTI